MPRVFFLYQQRRRLIASSTSDAFANRSYFFSYLVVDARLHFASTMIILY